MLDAGGIEMARILTRLPEYENISHQAALERSCVQ